MDNNVERIRVSGTAQHFIEECRERLIASPGDVLIEMQLATFLLMTDQFSEAASIAEGISDSPDAGFKTGTVRKSDACRAVTEAMRRSRGQYEDASRLIAGDAFQQIAMEQYELALCQLEEMTVFEETKSEGI